MTSFILGDNPFFAISHLGPEKTRAYLQDEVLFEKAKQVITLAGDMGMSDFMISSHDETRRLLEHTGYFQSPTAANLPDLIVNIPNVHKMNNTATQKGVLSSISGSFSAENLWGLLAFLPRGLMFTAARAAIKRLVAPFPAEKISHVCLHNIVTDMLLGIGTPYTLEVIVAAIISLGYMPAFISLNPVLADKLLPRDIPLCVYYNQNGFNMCPNKDTALAYIRTTERPLWAMGVLASGMVPVERALNDPDLDHFSKVIYASSSAARLRQAQKIWQMRTSQPNTLA